MGRDLFLRTAYFTRRERGHPSASGPAKDVHPETRPRHALAARQLRRGLQMCLTQQDRFTIAAEWRVYRTLAPETLEFIALSPIIGLIAGFGLMIAVYWIFRRVSPHRVDRVFRVAQLGSSALQLPKSGERFEDRQAAERAFVYDVPTGKLAPLAALDSVVERAGRILAAHAAR